MTQTIEKFLLDDQATCGSLRLALDEARQLLRDLIAHFEGAPADSGAVAWNAPQRAVFAVVDTLATHMIKTGIYVPPSADPSAATVLVDNMRAAQPDAVPFFEQMIKLMSVQDHAKHAAMQWVMAAMRVATSEQLLKYGPSPLMSPEFLDKVAKHKFIKIARKAAVDVDGPPPSRAAKADGKPGSDDPTAKYWAAKLVELCANHEMSVADKFTVSFFPAVLIVSMSSLLWDLNDAGFTVCKDWPVFKLVHHTMQLEGLALYDVDADHARVRTVEWLHHMRDARKSIDAVNKVLFTLGH